jgi:hypothetical protein
MGATSQVMGYVTGGQCGEEGTPGKPDQDAWQLWGGVEALQGLGGGGSDMSWSALSLLGSLEGSSKGAFW